MPKIVYGLLMVLNWFHFTLHRSSNSVLAKLCQSYMAYMWDPQIWQAGIFMHILDHLLWWSEVLAKSPTPFLGNAY